MLDHILLGVKDLEEGMVFMKGKCGVRPVVGGSHPGAGTRNALLSLGTVRYLEIIAPDPEQNSTPSALHTDLAALRSPALIGWAVHTRDIAGVAEKLRAAQIDAEGPLDGSRNRPDGAMLSWKTLRLKDDRGGIFPFFIEWGTGTKHPSAEAPGGCRLESFRLSSANPDELRETFRRMGIEVKVEAGAAQKLSAKFSGARGEFELTS